MRPLRPIDCGRGAPSEKHKPIVVESGVKGTRVLSIVLMPPRIMVSTLPAKRPSMVLSSLIATGFKLVPRKIVITKKNCVDAVQPCSVYTLDHKSDHIALA